MQIDALHARVLRDRLLHLKVEVLSRRGGPVLGARRERLHARDFEARVGEIAREAIGEGALIEGESEEAVRAHRLESLYLDHARSEHRDLVLGFPLLYKLALRREPAHHEGWRALRMDQVTDAQACQPRDLLAVAVERVMKAIDRVLSDVGKGGNYVDAVRDEAYELNQLSGPNPPLHDADRSPPAPIFFFNDPETTEIYTLPLHVAHPRSEAQAA